MAQAPSDGKQWGQSSHRVEPGPWRPSEESGEGDNLLTYGGGQGSGELPAFATNLATWTLLKPHFTTPDSLAAGLGQQSRIITKECLPHLGTQKR